MFTYELDLLVGSIKDVVEQTKEEVGLEFSFFNSLEQGFTITDDPLFSFKNFQHCYE